MRGLNDLAETVVVNETQSLLKMSCVVPVISSHCAEFVPPTRQANKQHKNNLVQILSLKHV